MSSISPTMGNTVGHANNAPSISNQKPAPAPAFGSEEHIQQIFSKINQHTGLNDEDKLALKDYLTKNGNSPEQAEAYVKNPVSFFGGEIKGG